MTERSRLLVRTELGQQLPRFGAWLFVVNLPLVGSLALAALEMLARRGDPLSLLLEALHRVAGNTYTEYVQLSFPALLAVWSGLRAFQHDSELRTVGWMRTMPLAEERVSAVKVLVGCGYILVAFASASAVRLLAAIPSGLSAIHPSEAGALLTAEWFVASAVSCLWFVVGAHMGVRPMTRTPSRELLHLAGYFIVAAIALYITTELLIGRDSDLFRFFRMTDYDRGGFVTLGTAHLLAAGIGFLALRRRYALVEAVR